MADIPCFDAFEDEHQNVVQTMATYFQSFCEAMVEVLKQMAGQPESQ